MLGSLLFTAAVAQSALADYTGLYRPQVHFSPPSGWLNDPNGLFRDETGTWHMYYQYNPDAPVGGNQHWGHATSPDLYHWTNQPAVLSPDPVLGSMFSGSAVVDFNNTSGFFPDQDNGVVAVYTAATPNGQKQALAYSKDSGQTFTQYDGNPVLEYSSGEFRDPKVFWHEDTNKWVMLVSYAGENTLAFYTSDDLKEWNRVSTWEHTGQGNGWLECPNITPIPFIPEGSDSATDTVWLMWVSDSGGNPTGGATYMEYYVGHFDGTTWTSFTDARALEFGVDNYAGQLWYLDEYPDGWEQKGLQGIHWVFSGMYGSDTPTADSEGWRGAQSLPRVYHVTNSTVLGQDFAVVAMPQDLGPVVGDTLANTDDLIGHDNSITAKSSGTDSSAGTFLINIHLENLTGASEGATLDIEISCSGTGESITATQTFDGSNQLVMDRSNTKGFDNDAYLSSRPTTNLGTISEYDMTVVVDRSIWEVFLMKGLRVGTEVFFVSEGNVMDTVKITSKGFSEDVKIDVDVKDLKSGFE